MRYFIYARKSTDDEDRQILSIETQLVELRAKRSGQVATSCEALEWITRETIEKYLKEQSEEK